MAIANADSDSDYIELDDIPASSVDHSSADEGLRKRPPPTEWKKKKKRKNEGKEERKDIVEDRVKKRPKCLSLRYALFYGYRLPVLRLLCIGVALVLQLILYVEDPISSSKAEARLWGWGRTYNFLFRYYPSPQVYSGWFSLKLIGVLTSIVFGYVWGKYLLGRAVLSTVMNHGLFKKDRGSWASAAFGCLLMLYVGSLIYDVLLETYWISYVFYDGSKYLVIDPENDGGFKMRTIDDKMGVSEEFLGYGTLLAFVYCYAYYIFFTVDAMIATATKSSDKKKRLYGCRSKSCSSLRNEWTTGIKRILFFWYGGVTVVVGLYGAWIFYRGYYYSHPIPPTPLANDSNDGIRLGPSTSRSISSDPTPHGYFGWNEVTRRWISSWVLTLLLLAGLQDWEFPKFRLRTSVYEASCCRGKRCKVSVHRRWLLITVWFALIAISANSYINQMRYVPSDYAQISDCDGRIRATFDVSNGLPVYLRPFRPSKNASNRSSSSNTILSIDGWSDPYCLSDIRGNDNNVVDDEGNVRYNASDPYDMYYLARNCAYPFDRFSKAWSFKEECFGSARWSWIPPSIVLGLLLSITIVCRLKAVLCKKNTADDGESERGDDGEENSASEETKEPDPYAVASSYAFSGDSER